MTMQTVTRLYDNYDDATQAVRDFEAAGVPQGDISIVAKDTDQRHNVAANRDAGSDTGTGAAIGSVVGGGAGLLAGLGMLAIPGVGPVVAAGWLVATAVGAAVGAGAGAAAGGLVGSLTAAGVSDDHARIYAEGIRRGGTLVTVRVDSGRFAAIEAIANRYHPVDPTARGNIYREHGWSGSDTVAPSGSSSDVMRERNRSDASI